MAKGQKGDKEKLGVRIVVELTGHMRKGDVQEFMAQLSTVVKNNVENGGNGG